MSSLPARRKLFILGDGGSGKTSLLIVFKGGQFPQYHLPTLFETSVVDVHVDGQTVELALFDSAGQEEYHQLRSLCYPDTDVIIIAFSIDSPDSLDNVLNLWHPDILHNCGTSVPYILVGCKLDARNSPEIHAQMKQAGLERGPVQYDEGRDVAARINARAYIECSAKEGKHVDQVFQVAARIASERQRHRPGTAGCCVIL